jgi:hypothetical protein
MREDTDNTVNRTLAECFGLAGEDDVCLALEEAGVDPEASAASVDPARIAGIVAPLIIERLEGPLAQALPGLAVRAESPVPLHALSTRAQNIARDNGLLTAGALGALSVSSLSSLQKAGRKTVHELVLLAVRLHLQLGTTSPQGTGRVDLSAAGLDPAFGADTPAGERPIASCSHDEILGQPTSSLNLSVRSRGCLNRLGIETIGALIQYTESELLATPNFGHTSLTEIRDRLSDCGLRFRRPDCIDATSHPDVQDSGKGQQERVSTDGTAASLGSLCAVLAEWAAHVRKAERFDEIMTFREGVANLPADVEAAASRLLSTSLEHFRAPDSHSQGLLDELFEGLDDRGRVIFEARHLCSDQVTLLAIGERYGLSRERVRQIARETSASIRSRLASRRFRFLRWRFHDVASTLGSGAPEESDLVVQALAKACRGITASARTRALILWASGPYRQREGWLLLKGVRRPSIPLDEDILSGEIEITRESVCAWLETMGFSAELALIVMKQSGTVKQIGDKWVRWPNTVTDKAAVVLRLLNRPADSAEIIELIGEPYSDVSLRNRLCDDTRFIRVNRRQFALTTWGLEEYSGITQEIVERIERDGGSTTLKPLVTELVRQFDVSELSVRAYANAPMFIIEDGVIRLRRDGDEYAIDTRIETVQGLFPDPDRSLVHLVLSVDADLRPSSGKSLKEPVAWALGMEPGDRLAFTGEANCEQVLVSWPESGVAGPYLGGTRGLLRLIEGEAGDECVLTLDLQRGVFLLRRVPNGLVDAAALTGLLIEPGHELDAVAESLGCKRTAVRSVLAARGDKRLLSILPSSTGDPQLDDALANLAHVLRDA